MKREVQVREDSFEIGIWANFHYCGFVMKLAVISP